MGQAVDQARRQRELSKQALQADLGRLEARVRSELDVRQRLRRDAPRILAVAGGAVLLVGAIVLVRARLARRSRPAEEPATLDDLVVELRRLRESMDKKKESGLLPKLALRAAGAAGAAGGSMMARRIVASRPDEQRAERAG